MQKRSKMLCHCLLSSQDGLFSQEPAAPSSVPSSTRTLAVYIVPLIWCSCNFTWDIWNVLKPSNWILFEEIKACEYGLKLLLSNGIIWHNQKALFLHLIKMTSIAVETTFAACGAGLCVEHWDNQLIHAEPGCSPLPIHSETPCSRLIALKASCSDTRANTCSHIKIQTWIVCEPCKVWFFFSFTFSNFYKDCN